MQRQYRLRHPNDFARLKSEGKLYRHPLFGLSVAANPLGHNRYGFVVSGKLGGAVVRNRCKRRLRELARKHHAGLKQGFDLVFLAREGVYNADSVALEAAFTDLLRRARLLP
jgi:ribonuclease P protein component